MNPEYYLKREHPNFLCKGKGYYNLCISNNSFKESFDIFVYLF